jgi:hypothetical protein
MLGPTWFWTVWLKARQTLKPQRVLRLAAYGLRQAGQREPLVNLAAVTLFSRTFLMT